MSNDRLFMNPQINSKILKGRYYYKGKSFKFSLVTMALTVIHPKLESDGHIIHHTGLLRSNHKVQYFENILRIQIRFFQTASYRIMDKKYVLYTKKKEAISRTLT